MSDILSSISVNQGVITTFATVIIAISAGITVWLTHSLIAENKLLRKIGDEPNIVVYLEEDDQRPQQINLVLVNVGRGPARNIGFQYNGISEDKADSCGLLLKNDHERTPIGFLPEGKDIHVLFGSAIELLSEPKLPPITVEVQWENLNEKQDECKYRVDISQFNSLFSSGASATNKIAASLEKIAKRLDGFAKGNKQERLRVETITTVEAKKEIEMILNRSNQSTKE